MLTQNVYRMQNIGCIKSLTFKILFKQLKWEIMDQGRKLDNEILYIMKIKWIKNIRNKDNLVITIELTYGGSKFQIPSLWNILLDD